MAAEDSASSEIARRAHALGEKIERALTASSALSAPAHRALFPEDEVAELENLRRELALAERRSEARSLEVGIIGQLNAGKSTLMNALAGRSLAPTSALPATGVFLRLDPRSRGARVVFLPERRRRPLALETAAEAERWITHDGNPRNREGVDCVELPIEASLLGAEVGLTDTPGEGDVLQAEPERLQRYLDERLDLALLVASSTSIWTRSTFEMLERALRRCPLVLLVANVDAGARNLDAEGRTLAARDDAALLRRLRERLSEMPRASRALESGSLHVHVVSARAAMAGAEGDAEALLALREEVRAAVEDPGFQRRRLAVLALNLEAAERGAVERARVWQARCAEQREIERREREAAVAAAGRRAEHAERAAREIEAREQDLVHLARGRAREVWESELCDRILRSLRAWRVRRDAAVVLLEEVDREIHAAELRLDESGQAALEEALGFAALLFDEDERAAPEPEPLAPLAPPVGTSFEALLGAPRFSGRFWLGLPFGLAAGYFAAGPATRQIEAWIDLPVAGPLLSAILGLLVALIAGYAIGVLAGAWAWRRLLRAGLPVLLKRLLVAGVDERRVRALGASIVERAGARAEERALRLGADLDRARADAEAHRQSAEALARSGTAAEEDRAWTGCERALEELVRC